MIFVCVDGEDQPIDVNEYNYGSELGNRTLVVHVPGKNGGKDSFDHLFKEYAQTENMFRQSALLVSYTHFGKQGSGGCIDGEDVTKQVFVLKALIKQYLDSKKSITAVYLVAHSMGCIIASRVATDSPHLVDKLVLLTPMFRISGFYDWIPSFVFRAVKLLGKIIPFSIQPHGNPMLNTGCLERRAEIAASPHREFHSLFDSCDALLECKAILRNEDVTCPCLVIVGSNDAIVCNTGAYKFCQKHTTARTYVEIDNARHSIHNETKAIKDELIKQLKEFFFSR